MSPFHVRVSERQSVEIVLLISDTSQVVGRHFVINSWPWNFSYSLLPLHIMKDGNTKETSKILTLEDLKSK